MSAPGDKELFEFLANAPKGFREGERIRKFQLKNGDYMHCVLWDRHFFITGTDIVKVLIWRFQNAGRCLSSLKKFEEGIFSDLRNLKPGIDATLENPRSEFLEFLYKNGCIRTQKKQKVFYWYSVPHDALFCDALERDLRRETNLFTYNKYINNLARNNVVPHGMTGFGSHTRQSSKRVGPEMDHRYLRSIENKVLPMGVTYEKKCLSLNQDIFFDKGGKKQAGSFATHQKQITNPYDEQFEEIRRNGLLDMVSYRELSKDEQSSPWTRQHPSHNTREEYMFHTRNEIHTNLAGGKPHLSSINNSSVDVHHEKNQSFLEELPNGFSLDDFDFLRYHTEKIGEGPGMCSFKDGEQRIQKDDIALIENTGGGRRSSEIE